MGGDVGLSLGVTSRNDIVGVMLLGRILGYPYLKGVSTGSDAAVMFRNDSGESWWGVAGIDIRK